ncbi:MAG TPA: 5'-methylthioadenosine/S-adenosylhomocysteine nucleosidase [Candidatus Dormibacteraeota bacterium]
MAPRRIDRPVAILVALEVEAQALVRQLAPSTVSSPRLSVWEGLVEGAPVVLVITGIGKVAAALAAQFTCDKFDPRGLIVVGLAGATGSDGRRGELVVASGALQHDMDARPFTDSRGVIPSLGQAVFAADPTLSERLRHASESVVSNPRIVRSGVVLTGDQIVSSRAVRDSLVAGFPNGVCLDMETAAIAQVAHQNGVPWAALRITSDAADENFNLEDVLGFGLDTAADLFDRIVRAFLKAL